MENFPKASQKVRMTVKLKTPNPLFEKWITEWRDKAIEENSRMASCFNKALESLRKYPLPMESGRECKILIGFGDTLCGMLDNKLKEYNKNKNPGCNLENKVILNCNVQDGEPNRKRNVNKSPRKSLPKEYIPKEGSGGYAILVTLYKKGLEPSYPGYLTKRALIEQAQCLSDTHFIKPMPGTRYTAWSSMRTLISKNLVQKVSNPPKFSLTSEGLVLARKLYEEKYGDFRNKIIDNPVVCLDLSDEEVVTKKIKPTTKPNTKNNNKKKLQSSTSNSYLTSSSNNSVISFESTSDENIVSHSQTSKTIQKYASSSSIASSTQSYSQEETVIFLPDSFDIILCVDTQETGGSNTDIRTEPILGELKSQSVLYEVRKLKVGDYAWICRDRSTKNELILPYIIERKRMDDFSGSIKDGRYNEQKFRLKKSGIQNITYLIESYGSNQHGLPITTLHQAATNMAIQDNFCIKFTESYKGTARYLANFTTLLTNIFKSKTLVSCPKENLSDLSLEDDLVSLMTFKEFNKSSSKIKPLKVSDMFVKMLIQTKGMSVDKALAIVREYPTPEVLRREYEKNPGVKGEKLLAHIQFSDNKRTIGLPLSKTIYQLFTKQYF